MFEYSCVMITSSSTDLLTSKSEHKYSIKKSSVQPVYKSIKTSLHLTYKTSIFAKEVRWMQTTETLTHITPDYASSLVVLNEEVCLEIEH